MKAAHSFECAALNFLRLSLEGNGVDGFGLDHWNPGSSNPPATNLKTKKL